MATKRTSKYRAKEGEGRQIILLPKNENQAAYIKALKTSDQVIVTGPAGTGKTFIASTYAATLFAQGKIDKIILTRPNVASGRSLGFFPGTMEEKMAPWVIPFTDVLHACLGEGAFNIAMQKKQIDIVIGTRFAGAAISHTPQLKRLILRAAAWLSPSSRRLGLTDAHNGLRVFDKTIADHLNLTMSGMSHAGEFVALIDANRWRVTEEPVEILYTEYSLAKGQSMLNGVNIVFDGVLRGRIRR